MLLGAGPVGAESEAWWLRATFEPRGLEVLGIPVRAIDSEWIAASPLTPDELPPDAREPGFRIEDTELRLSIDGDFERDGKTDKALVGVYRTRSGAVGRFLLIASENFDGAWEKRAVFSDPGSPGFSALTYRGGEVQWWDCMLCGSYQAVVLQGGTFKLDPFGGNVSP